MDFIIWIVENQENLRDTYRRFKEETGDQEIPLDEFLICPPIPWALKRVFLIDELSPRHANPNITFFTIPNRIEANKTDKNKESNDPNF